MSTTSISNASKFAGPWKYCKLKDSTNRSTEQLEELLDIEEKNNNSEKKKNKRGRNNDKVRKEEAT